MAKSTNLGYPRIGKRRELKRIIERYWSGKASADELASVAKDVRAAAFQVQLDAEIDLIPCADFTLYDHVLDTSCLWGLVPGRFGHDRGSEVSLDTFFAMARGDDDTPALELTKWFDTNYHYLVPEFDSGEPYRASNRPVELYEEARDAVGDRAKPVLLGPVSFVLLGKHHTKSIAAHIADLVPLYKDLLNDLATAGAEWVQIDEPCLVLDLDEAARDAYKSAYGELSSAGVRIMLQTYFGSLRDNWETAVGLPVDGIGLDFVRDGRNLDDLLHKGFPEDKVLSAGVVNGRGVWKADLEQVLGLLGQLESKVDSNDLWIGPSCSMLLLPHDVNEESHDEEQLRNLSFAEQRLNEIFLLKKAINEGTEAIATELELDHQRTDQASISSTANAATQERVSSLTDEDFQRAEPIRERLATQMSELGLPSFPTTTIGSFPQASDVRSMRAKYRRGSISSDEYQEYVHDKIDELIGQQEEIDLDVLVHGEFERTDMVEFFAEKLEGFITTQYGWVQSYGTRCVRPPIIIGDVYRDEPMTVAEISYAQSKTSKPVKGMLTGPVTILQWSYPREDIDDRTIAYQIGLALRDEVADLEDAGIRIIQIDEPAFREGLPLAKEDWSEYLDWAVKAFRLSSSGVAAGTQIHSHMCYSEFNDIIEAIDALEADVISIENSRSSGEILQVLRDYDYAGQIGPGVYDIHSPRVPDTPEMVGLLDDVVKVLDADVVWVNPDCGLKTRKDAEVWPSLANMVAAAKELRERVSSN
ncbi:MAG: 5-methyltetrahydropteroyltriglutamate--homocysteine S-methyltransferase [Thermomicrobiales bacterium]